MTRHFFGYFNCFKTQPVEELVEDSPKTHDFMPNAMYFSYLTILDQAPGHGDTISNCYKKYKEQEETLPFKTKLHYLLFFMFYGVNIWDEIVQLYSDEKNPRAVFFQNFKDQMVRYFYQKHKNTLDKYETLESNTVLDTSIPGATKAGYTVCLSYPDGRENNEQLKMIFRIMGYIGEFQHAVRENKNEDKDPYSIIFGRDDLAQITAEKIYSLGLHSDVVTFKDLRICSGCVDQATQILGSLDFDFQQEDLSLLLCGY
jgi:hypothetical protein